MKFLTRIRVYYLFYKLVSTNKKRRENSNTQNEIQKNFDSNIEIQKKSIISPRHFVNNQLNIFDKINEIKNDKVKVSNNQNYKNARNINLINNQNIMKNYDASETIYTNNNFSDTHYRIIVFNL